MAGCAVAWWSSKAVEGQPPSSLDAVISDTNSAGHNQEPIDTILVTHCYKLVQRTELMGIFLNSICSLRLVLWCENV